MYINTITTCKESSGKKETRKKRLYCRRRLAACSGLPYFLSSSPSIFAAILFVLCVQGKKLEEKKRKLEGMHPCMHVMSGEGICTTNELVNVAVRVVVAPKKKKWYELN